MIDKKDLEDIISLNWKPKIKKIRYDDHWDYEMRFHHLERHHEEETHYLIKLIKELAQQLLETEEYHK